MNAQFDENQKRLILLNQENGASTWLTTLPLKDEGYVLNKQQFWDLVHIRYGWYFPKNRLSEKCECGAAFTIQHALSFKKGGFVSLRHNHIKNITATLLSEVCKDIRLEPVLQEFTGEEPAHHGSNEARSDISTRGFWSRPSGIFQHKGF